MRTKKKKYWALGILILFIINGITQSRGEEKEIGEYQKSQKKIIWLSAKEPDTTSHLDRYIISSSNAKKFDNWQYGEADLYIIKSLPFGSNIESEHKIGTIKADGSFSLNLPEMATENKISDFFKCRYMESPPETSYSNPDTGLRHALITVIRDGESIGSLSLASSRQQAYNNSPYGQYRGNPGYRLEWWYAVGQASAKVNCKRMNSEQFEIQSIYELEFKQGWNLMKVEIAESYNEQFYKIKKYSIVPSLPDDVKWVFNQL